MKKKPLGAALPMVLLMASLMFVLGLGFLAKKSAQLRATKQIANSYKAKSLAWAGLEDARVKLNKDPLFPPGLGKEQQFYSYTEVLTNLDGNEVGSYTVNIDMRYQNHPFRVLLISSTGRAGIGEVGARRTLATEFDLAPDIVAGERSDDEDTSTFSNPNYWRFVNVRDRGGF